MIYGALNNLNDPTHQKRDKHASIYYESIRNSNKEIFIKRISGNTRIDYDLARKAVNHVFFTKHYLQEDITYKYDYFSPNYDMAESWQRMSEGVNV